MSPLAPTVPVDSVAGGSTHRVRTAAVRSDAPRSPDELKRVCQEMESLFINQLLKEMRQSIPKGGLFEENNAEEMFKGMHDEALAGQIAGSGGLGLARVLMAQLSQNQASADGAPEGPAAPPLKVSASGTDNSNERQPRSGDEDAILVSPDGPDLHRQKRGTPWK
ncbi:MAG: rod-binding protein [Pseudomonadota bacterium]